jgi:hypothetical protein
MKYINKFSTNAEYQAFKVEGNYVTPNVCYIVENNGFIMKPYIKPIIIKPIITFTIDGIEYQAEEGMTWEDWVNSEYNPSLENGGYYIHEGNTIWNATRSILGIISTDKIIANKAYEHAPHSGGAD